MTWLRLIQEAGETGWLAYAVTTVCITICRARGRDIPPLLRAVRAELRPFALLLVSAAYGPAILTHPGPRSVLVCGIQVVFWWFWRNDEDDDDRWKRRRQRLAAKVAEVGGKLAIVPAGSPA